MNFEKLKEIYRKYIFDTYNINWNGECIWVSVKMLYEYAVEKGLIEKTLLLRNL